MKVLARTTYLAAAVIAGASLKLPLLAADPPRISNNPFSRPVSSAPVNAGPETVDSRSPQWTPELRATLVSSRARYANVTGTILALGESAGGYRLVALEENRAVLAKDGERIVLYVRPDAASSNDE